MITGPDWLLVENPKAASQSMRQALAEFRVTPHRHQPYWGTAHRIRGVCVRNPFDRMVSGFFYYLRNNPSQSFAEWTAGRPWYDMGYDLKRTSQMIWAWGCTDVMRYENLDEDWPSLLHKIGLKDRSLPRLNASGDRPHYRDVIDSKSRVLIEDRFAPDLSMWGYRW